MRFSRYWRLCVGMGTPHRLAEIDCQQGIDLANGQAEIACHAAVIRCHKSLGGPAALCLPGVSQQPVVQGWPAAVESFQPMLQTQRSWAAQAHALSERWMPLPVAYRSASQLNCNNLVHTDRCGESRAVIQSHAMISLRYESALTLLPIKLKNA